MSAWCSAKPGQWLSGQTSSTTTTLAQFSKYWGENSFTNAKATKLSTVWVDSHNMLPKVSFLRTDVVILGKPGTTQLPFQRPEGATDQQAQARRNPLGRLPPEPGRQRIPLLPIQRSGGYPVGDPGIRGRIPLAYRNGVRDGEKRRGPGRVRDPHLDWLASPCGPVPAGRSFSAEPATGLGGKGCPGNGLGQLSYCGGLRIRRTVTNGPDDPMPSAAPPFAPPRKPRLELSL